MTIKCIFMPALYNIPLITHVYIFLLQQLITNPGEWWNSDTEAVIKQALRSGAGPNVSDAYTINGQPGALYDCSAKGNYLYYY